MLTGHALDAFCFRMRLGPPTFLTVMLLGLALAACHRSSGGASASSVEAGAPSASASAVASGRFKPAMSGMPRGPAGMGNQCDDAKQAAVCSPDGKMQMSCALGMWKTVASCDGPAGCKGSGDDLKCDVARPVKEGDDCKGGFSPPRCNDGQTYMSCVNTKWKKIVCAAPGHCREPDPAKDFPAGCRL